MELRETFVLISNQGIEVKHNPILEQPLYNYIAIHLRPDAGKTNLSSLEATYRYGQEEQEELEVALTDLEALRGQFQVPAPNLTTALARHTQGWADPEAAHLLQNLSMTSLEESGTSRQQLILDAFVASLGVYLTFAELTRQPQFARVTPLAYSFSAPAESNLLAAGVQQQVRFQAQLSSAMGRNEMGSNLAVATLSFVNTWSDLFRSRPEPGLLTESVAALETHLLSQVEKANVAVQTFEQASAEMHQTLDQLRRRISGADQAVLGTVLERVTRDMDAQLKKRLATVVTTATTSVADNVKHTFRKHLAEIYTEYDQVLKDNIDQIAEQTVRSKQAVLDENLREMRNCTEDTKKTREEVAQAVAELRGLPRELAQVKAQTAKTAGLEERVVALERQIARLLARSM